ncbi:transcriptional regulator, TetR family [Natronincola peptidivorans]|uniref:Transcriptional regulator, TetR family n=1 Tax=Natronincola peptidivorans TaxID=426128 RepID=A0A1I0B187_9FIRM|nr:TetR/AcrR family transcriptional regulator [Natronincola peptidivorans]SET00483.1 transcriptional regulator, TetR family [Natronincola peptidivorans]
MGENEKDTREKIIAAAYEVLAREGYEKASTKEIAKEAGVAQGLINYYFNKKDDLFIEVFKKEKERYGEFLENIANVPTEELMGKIMTGLEEKVINHSEWYRLRYELFALGMRNPAFNTEIKNFMEEGRSNVKGVLSKVYPKIDAGKMETLAAIIIVCLDGLALQKTTDSEFNIDKAYLALFEMIEAISK